MVLCGVFFGVWVGFVGLDYLVVGLIWVFALICVCVCCFGVLFSCYYLWVMYFCLELSCFACVVCVDTLGLACVYGCLAALILLLFCFCCFGYLVCLLV